MGDPETAKSPYMWSRASVAHKLPETSEDNCGSSQPNLPYPGSEMIFFALIMCSMGFQVMNSSKYWFLFLAKCTRDLLPSSRLAFQSDTRAKLSKSRLSSRPVRRVLLERTTS